MADSHNRNVGILISLLKESNIKRVILSPGAMNVVVSRSIQLDPWFEAYSAPDERSAAYMACGMAARSGEPVVLSCTGATASRNYLPGLTEAFYRKIPVLAVTSSQPFERVGHLSPQMLDRSSVPRDVANASVRIPEVKDEEDARFASLAINEALLALKHRGGGPAHIDLVTERSIAEECTTDVHPVKIARIMPSNAFPAIPSGKIGVFVGAHPRFDEGLQESIDLFCAMHDAVVLCDLTSNYRGKYAVFPSLVFSQDLGDSALSSFDLLIHLGEVSGAYMPLRAKEVWRVSQDGALRDTFGALTNVFEMSETFFFAQYNSSTDDVSGSDDLLNRLSREDELLRSRIPDLPFSNIWCALQMSPLLQKESVLHLGILNSLRAWNLVPPPASIECSSNTGGFGIDGCVSTLIGSALADLTTINYGVVGDLAFFYDMNSLGNRHVPANLRLLVINNGCGAEFRIYNHVAAPLGAEADEFVAAAGHNGNRSSDLLRHYAEDLGFLYLSASDKVAFSEAIGTFVKSEIDRPIVFEVFTDPNGESEALRIMRNLTASWSGIAKHTAKKMLGQQGVRFVKRLVKGV